MKKYLIAIILTIFSVIPMATLADVLPEGERGVNNQFVLDNISAYPGYNIYLTFPQSKYPGAQQITQNTTPIIFSGPAQLIAVKKEDQGKIKPNTIAGCPECGDNWYASEANKNLIISSNVNLNFSEFVPETSPVTTVTTTVHIDSLSSNAMTAHLVTGDSEKKDVNPIVAPVVLPVQTPINALLVAALIVCLGIIGILAAKLAWKK